MAVELIRSPRLYSGAPYAYAAIAYPAAAPPAAAHPAAGFVFTAGACPLDADGRVVAPGDIAEQARVAVKNLFIALEECGSGVRDVLKSTVYVASGTRADLVTAWNEVAAAFGDHDAPSTLLGVAVLGYEDQLVEIEAIAVAGSR